MTLPSQDDLDRVNDPKSDDYQGGPASEEAALDWAAQPEGGPSPFLPKRNHRRSYGDALSAAKEELAALTAQIELLEKRRAQLEGTASALSLLTAEQPAALDWARNPNNPKPEETEDDGA